MSFFQPISSEFIISRAWCCCRSDAPSSDLGLQGMLPCELPLASCFHVCIFIWSDATFSSTRAVGDSVPSPDLCCTFSFFSDFSAGNTTKFSVSRVKSMYGVCFLWVVIFGFLFFFLFSSSLFPTATPSAFHLSTETFFYFHTTKFLSFKSVLTPLLCLPLN